MLCIPQAPNDRRLARRRSAPSSASPIRSVLRRSQLLVASQLTHSVAKTEFRDRMPNAVGQAFSPTGVTRRLGKPLGRTVRLKA